MIRTITNGVPCGVIKNLSIYNDLCIIVEKLPGNKLFC